MRISSLGIKNFKAIRELEITDIEDVLILVGKNNTGKTIILDAIRAVFGEYELSEKDCYEQGKNITISMSIIYDEDDLDKFHKLGKVSRYKSYDSWYRDFCGKLPSFRDNELTFEFIYNSNNRNLGGRIRYCDGIKKNNIYIPEVFPKIYYVDHMREINDSEDIIMEFMGNKQILELKEHKCMFDTKRECNSCFNCIGMINKKTPEELSIVETEKLFEYKLLSMNLQNFADRLNIFFHKNGGYHQDIRYDIKLFMNKMFKIDTKVINKERNVESDMNSSGEGLKSLYLLSLLETYAEEEEELPCIIMLEGPENYLHPQMQKVSSEILYRLSRKNQVIFSTHSPNMIFNFNERQIKQVLINRNFETAIAPDTDIDEILEDLGYNATDFMNVNFVFIVEGKQDRSRLPLLLEKYYSEIYDEEGKLKRISIIQTNSCTNIKTYANLKYMNKVYLKDNFLMIRDSDGKNPKYLTRQLCSYYANKPEEEYGTLPRVTPKNVLVLKYYSFENYFLDPKVMARIGVIKNEEEFYNILYSKYKDYLYKLASTKRMLRDIGVKINSKKELKDNIEKVKIYIRGHNLFDIFYGRYRGDALLEKLKEYIDVAPRDCFKDILDAIDSFVYFNSKKIED